MTSEVVRGDTNTSQIGGQHGSAPIKQSYHCTLKRPLKLGSEQLTRVLGLSLPGQSSPHRISLFLIMHQVILEGTPSNTWFKVKRKQKLQ